MAKRNTLQKQVDHALMSKAHIGESRHAAKQELRDIIPELKHRKYRGNRHAFSSLSLTHRFLCLHSGVIVIQCQQLKED